jgi:hypothetical protein
VGGDLFFEIDRGQRFIPDDGVGEKLRRGSDTAVSEVVNQKRKRRGVAVLIVYLFAIDDRNGQFEEEDEEAAVGTPADGIEVAW